MTLVTVVTSVTVVTVVSVVTKVTVVTTIYCYDKTYWDTNIWGNKYKKEKNGWKGEKNCDNKFFTLFGFLGILDKKKVCDEFFSWT